MKSPAVFILAFSFTYAASTLAADAPAGASPPPTILKIEAFPPSITLESARDRQSVVVRGIDATGVTHDLTASATFEPANPAILNIDHAVMIPQADGETTVTISALSQSVQIPVKSLNATVRPSLVFRNDVLPALTRSGCNNGACHGSARGQDGFHLSLFGYDPAGDYNTLTRELPGRRLNTALPDDSLTLLKATGAVPHTGGQRFSKEDPRYRTLREWLEAGASADPPTTPVVVALEIHPQNIVLGGIGATQRLTVRAAYSDGTDRDVTTLAVFVSNNDFAAKVSEDGAITAAHLGEALVMARFDALSVGTQVLIVPVDAPAGNAPRPSNNYIDDHINAKLQKLRVQPSDLCSDEAFLRRIYIDMVGLLPTIDEYNRYFADDPATRREHLIDELMQRKEFTEIWVMKWAERLQIRSTLEVSYKAMLLYYNWLSERIASGTPINQIVRDIVASGGGTFTNPATNFYQLEIDTLKLTENVAQSFLGMRIQCAQCHNHPFDRWTMDDYYGFAAFFSQIGRKAGEDPREMIIFNSGNGDMRHPVGGRVMAPKFLGGETPDLTGKDRRAVLADWLTSKENRMFARNVANFIWAHYFGRGIIEPADDLRISNPPANAELLEDLADRLVAYDYDLRKLVRDICLSHAYQRSSETNESNALDQTNFSHGLIRRIRAESLLDSISAVTQTKNKFAGLPLGAHAAQIPDGNTSDYFLTTFGRARRESVCTCEVVMEPNLSQALHLLNGENVHQRIKDGRVIESLLKSGTTPSDVLDRLYLTCLSRKPTDAERTALLQLLPGEGDPQPALEDAFWAILNSREFMFTH